MTRKGDTVLAAALKRYGKKIRKYIQNCIAKPLTVKVLIEDARDSAQKTSGVISIEIEIGKPGGWGDYHIIEIHGTVGLEKTGKPGKKEDEAYLDGVTVGDWDEGSKAIGLNGCSIGEFLVHMFTLFAIKAGNESVLLDNAAGPRGEHIYKQVGFIKSKGDRAQYGEDNEMIFSLTGKKKNKDAGQLWRERYNKFRKKLKTKIKNSAKCKTFWKCVPPALEAPGPVHAIARGSKRKTRKKRGGRNETNQNIYYIIQNNAENIRRFQEQVFSPDANAEDAEGFNNLIFMLENMQRLDAGGFWIVEYSLTRDLDDNYHHYHLAWENNIPDINDNPDLENAIRFINDEQNGGGKRHKKKTRRKKGGNGKDNKTKKKKETKCAGIRNAFGQCMTAAKKTTTFNKSVIDAQDTSLGQFKTDNPSILMGFPSGKGGGRKKKGGLLGPRELEEGRQYLYTGPEPHFMPQAEWQTPVRITVTYRGRNVPGLTPNRHYFDGEREIARDGHSLDIFSLDNADIEQHIQPWVQNSGPSRVTNPSGVYAPRPRRESTCENCTIMGGGKQRGGDHSFFWGLL